eukprot:Nk52_evm41s158 gene=Nk52_evmTU41s158
MCPIPHDINNNNGGGRGNNNPGRGGTGRLSSSSLANAAQRQSPRDFDDLFESAISNVLTSEVESYEDFVSRFVYLRSSLLSELREQIDNYSGQGAGDGTNSSNNGLFLDENGVFEGVGLGSREEEDQDEEDEEGNEDHEEEGYDDEEMSGEGESEEEIEEEDEEYEDDDEELRENRFSYRYSRRRRETALQAAARAGELLDRVLATRTRHEERGSDPLAPLRHNSSSNHHFTGTDIPFDPNHADSREDLYESDIEEIDLNGTGFGTRGSASNLLSRLSQRLRVDNYVDYEESVSDSTSAEEGNDDEYDYEYDNGQAEGNGEDDEQWGGVDDEASEDGEHVTIQENDSNTQGERRRLQQGAMEESNVRGLGANVTAANALASAAVAFGTNTSAFNHDNDDDNDMRDEEVLIRPNSRGSGIGRGGIFSSSPPSSSSTPQRHYNVDDSSIASGRMSRLQYRSGISGNPRTSDEQDTFAQLMREVQSVSISGRRGSGDDGSGESNTTDECAEDESSYIVSRGTMLLDGRVEEEEGVFGDSGTVPQGLYIRSYQDLSTCEEDEDGEEQDDVHSVEEHGDGDHGYGDDEFEEESSGEYASDETYYSESYCSDDDEEDEDDDEPPPAFIPVDADSPILSRHSYYTNGDNGDEQTHPSSTYFAPDIPPYIANPPISCLQLVRNNDPLVSSASNISDLD